MVEKVSLYIPCYNAEKTIAQCIEGVLNQTYPIEEILIIDDGASDNTVSIASKYNVKIIRHKENRGLAEARNTGVLNSENEYVASIDADCVPEYNWLEILMETLSKDTVSGVGGRLLEENINTLADQWRAGHLNQSWDNKRITNPRQLYGNNTVFRKSDLVDVGLYNPKYKTNSEDYNISRRLKEKGYKLIYNPRAMVKHIRTDTVRSVMNVYCEYYYFGYIRKINILNTTRGILTNLFFSTSFFVKDLLTGKIHLLPMDIFSFIFAIYKNICRANPF